MGIEAESNIVWNVYKGVLHNTHVDTVNEFMGLQWVIYNATLCSYHNKSKILYSLERNTIRLWL